MPEVNASPTTEAALRRLLEASEEALGELQHASACPRSIVGAAECRCIRARLAQSIEEARALLDEPIRAICFPINGKLEKHVAPFNLWTLLRQTIGRAYKLLPRSAYTLEGVQVFHSAAQHSPENMAATEYLRAPSPLRGPVLVLENVPDEPPRP